MVTVGVGDEDGVEMVDMVAQHLLTKVGADVEKDVG